MRESLSPRIFFCHLGGLFGQEKLHIVYWSENVAPHPFTPDLQVLDGVVRGLIRTCDCVSTKTNSRNLRKLTFIFNYFLLSSSNSVLRIEINC